MNKVNIGDGAVVTTRHHLLWTIEEKLEFAEIVNYFNLHETKFIEKERMLKKFVIKLYDKQTEEEIK